MGTTEGGQDNAVCIMPFRALPVSAGKMSGAERSGGTSSQHSPPDVLHLCGGPGQGKQLASFSVPFVGLVLGLSGRED